ncbi:hypothetical protein H0H93_007653 [Arthromyces matolae]|nr:hypothetical protein H0H93_007653 [Arthromyces matolae]
MKTLLLSISALLLTKFFLVAAHPIPQTVTPIQVLESPPHNGSFVGEIDVLQNQEAAGLRTLVPDNNNLEARTDPPVWQYPPIKIPQVFVPSSSGNWILYLNVPYPGNTMGVSSILSVLRYMESAMGDEGIRSIVSGFQTTLMQSYKLTALPQLGQQSRNPLSPSQFETLQNKIDWAVTAHNAGNWLEDGILRGGVETLLTKNIVASQVYQQSHPRVPSRLGPRVPPGPPPSSYLNYYVPPSQPIIAPQGYQQSPSRAPSQLGRTDTPGPPASSYPNYSVTPIQPPSAQTGQQPHSRVPSRHGYRVPLGPPPSSYEKYYEPPNQPPPTQLGQQPHIRAPSRLGRTFTPGPPGPPPSSDQFNSYYTGIPAGQYGPAQIGQSYASTRHSAVPTYQYNSHLAPSPYSMPGISESPSYGLIPNNHGTLGPSDVDPNISGAHPSYPQYSNPTIQGNNQYGPAIPPIPLYGPHVNDVAPKMSFMADPSAPLPSTLLWERAGYIRIPSDFLSGELDMSVPTVDNPEGYNAMVELLGSIVSTAPRADLSNIMGRLRKNYKFSLLYKSSLKVVPVDPENLFAFRDEVKQKLDQYNKRFVPDARRDNRQWEPQPYNDLDPANLAMQRRKKRHD